MTPAGLNDTVPEDSQSLMKIQGNRFEIYHPNNVGFSRFLYAGFTDFLNNM